MTRSLLSFIVILLVCFGSFFLPINSYISQIDHRYRRVSPVVSSARNTNYNRETVRRKNNPGEDDDRDVEPMSSRKSRSSDPWKVLITKLDSTKGDPSSFGKKVMATKMDNTVDQLQCRHFGACSGCTIKGNFTDAPVVKQARLFFASESMNLNVHIGDPHEWRTHVKLAVQPQSRWGGLKIGLYKAGSHEVEPISNCRVHHPRINEVVQNCFLYSKLLIEFATSDKIL